MGRIARLGPLAMLLALAGLARAQEPPRDVARQALEHYQEGMTAYRAGQYDRAIELFTRAHELDPAPILLFNIGQAHFKKGNRAEALRFYRQYLVLAPDTPTREQVEARIRELEAEPEPAPAVEPPAAAPEPPPVLMPPPPPPAAAPLAAVTLADRPPPRPLHRRPLFWVVVGTVAAGAAVAVALLATRRDSSWECGDCNWSSVHVPGR